MTALARPLDPKYFTNRLVLLLTPLAGIIAGCIMLLDSGDFLQAVQAGFSMGVAVFLSWIVSREVDPKYDYSAFVAMAITFVGMLALPIASIDVLAILTVMLGGRVLHRIVGVPASVLDSAILLIYAGVTVVFSPTWLAAIMIPLALFFDAVLPMSIRRHLVLSVVGFSIIAGLAIITNQTVNFAVPDTSFLLLAGVISVGFLATIIHTGMLAITTDSGGECNTLRVQVSMALALCLALIGLFFFEVNYDVMLPLWSILIATVVYRIGIIARILRK